MRDIQNATIYPHCPQTGCFLAISPLVKRGNILFFFFCDTGVMSLINLIRGMKHLTHLLVSEFSLQQFSKMCKKLCHSKYNILP